MTIDKVKKFLLENYQRRILFTKEKNGYCSMKLERKKMLLLATKLTKLMPDASNAKEYYQSFLINENKRLVKRSKMNLTIKHYRKPKHY